MNNISSPRIADADVVLNIADCYYFTAADGALAAQRSKADYRPEWESPENIQALAQHTLCVLLLKNGSTVSGDCAGEFDSRVARSVARTNATRKIADLMNYALKDRLAA